MKLWHAAYVVLTVEIIRGIILLYFLLLFAFFLQNSQRLCFLLSLCVLAQSNPHLRTSVPSGSRVYVHQPITITCSTRGHILVWESNEYIGLGGQLTFASGDSRGRRANSEINNQTFAVLTSIEPELESQLSLTVASNYQSFTITCRNVDQGLADNVTYITSGE